MHIGEESMGKQIYQVDGFTFFDKELAGRAEKEAAGVKYLKEKIDMTQPEAVLSVYNKTIREGLFETPVGISYLRELQQYLKGIPYMAKKDILPIPVQKAGVDSKQEKAHKKEGKTGAHEINIDFKKRYQILFIICALLVVMVVSMFAITVTSDSPTIFNYATKLVNRYETGEQELDEREQALEAME